jgi:hypothetical protein
METQNYLAQFLNTKNIIAGNRSMTKTNNLKNICFEAL